MQRRGDKLENLKKYCTNRNVEDIRNNLSRLFPKLARAFDFYAAMGANVKAFQRLDKENWNRFLHDCDFLDDSAVSLDAAETERKKSSRGRRAPAPATAATTADVLDKKCSDAEAVFESCCRKEKEKGMLLRYEFLEAICHLSVLIYIKDEECEASMLAQAIPLLGQKLSEKIPTSVLEDANGWRERRLYRHDVDAALRPVVGMLKSLFIVSPTYALARAHEVRLNAKSSRHTHASPRRCTAR